MSTEMESKYDTLSTLKWWSQPRQVHWDHFKWLRRRPLPASPDEHFTDTALSGIASIQSQVSAVIRTVVLPQPLEMIPVHLTRLRPPLQRGEGVVLGLHLGGHGHSRLLDRTDLLGSNARARHGRSPESDSLSFEYLCHDLTSTPHPPHQTLRVALEAAEAAMLRARASAQSASVSELRPAKVLGPQVAGRRPWRWFPGQIGTGIGEQELSRLASSATVPMRPIGMASAWVAPTELLSVGLSISHA